MFVHNLWIQIVQHLNHVIAKDGVVVQGRLVSVYKGRSVGEVVVIVNDVLEVRHSLLPLVDWRVIRGVVAVRDICPHSVTDGDISSDPGDIVTVGAHHDEKVLSLIRVGSFDGEGRDGRLLLLPHPFVVFGPVGLYCDCGLSGRGLLAWHMRGLNGYLRIWPLVGSAIEPGLGGEEEEDGEEGEGPSTASFYWPQRL